MIKILIIDDEPASANILKILIDKHIVYPKLVETCLSASKALQIMPVFKPTLLMLDIEMPEMSGFDLLNRSAGSSFDVIFTTAYDKYAIKAIRFSALDYLLKPIDIIDLQNAINRHIVRNNSQPLNQQPLLDNLLHNLQKKDSNAFKLALATIEQTYFFAPIEIMWCEGNNNYTHFHFTEHPPLIVSKTLKEYEEILTEFGFVRVHKSYLVNARHVTNLSKEGFIKMSDGCEITVSRRRKEEVLRTIKLHGR
jgi:two-component system, LytTR family, response regulator